MMPGNSLRRPTLRLTSGLTRKRSVVLGLQTVSQFTADETRLGNTSHTRNLETGLNLSRGTLGVRTAEPTHGSPCLLLMSTSTSARGPRLGEQKAWNLPESTLVLRFPR